MNFIGELIKLSKKHAQAINIALLAVLASGSIAGGFWIRNLYTIIDEKKAALADLQQIQARRQELEEQRLAAATAEAKASLDELTRRVDELTRDMAKTKTYVERLGAITTRHVDVDASVADALSTVSSGGETIDRAVVAAHAGKLREEATRVRADVAEAAAWVDYASRQFATTAIVKSINPPLPDNLPEAASGQLSVVSLVLLVAMVGSFVYLWRLIRRKLA